MAVMNRIDMTSVNMRDLGDLNSQIKGNNGLVKITDELRQQSAEAQAKAEREAKAGQVRVRVDSILGLNSGYGLNANKANYFTENFYSTSVTHDPKTGQMKYNFSGYAAYSADRKLFDNNGVMPSYLNAKGADKYLNTPVGQMEVFLDLDDDNDQYGVGTLDYVGQLINLDINQDGILNSDDEFFDKLKLRGYNSNGEEVILKFTDVYNSLDLTKFVNTQKDVKGDQVSGTSLFRPELSYKQLNEEQKHNFKTMFKDNADESGWIDFRKTYKDESGIEQLVYGDLVKSLNLAYKKVGINGVENLELLRFNVYDGRNGDFSKGYVMDKKERFSAMYENYYNSKDYGEKLAIEREFQVITGMKFSEEKFKEFYNGLNNPSTATKYANALKDVDSVVAMKLNDNGMLTLKFDSGRTIDISLEDLFTSDGEFNITSKGEKASIMSESLNDDALNKLDFAQIGMQTNNGIVSLADLGIQFIQKEMLKNGKTTFVLTKENGSTLVASSLYKVRNVEDMIKFAELEEKDKLRATKFEREA
ncbi:hypothetical protein [Helicobacter sp.]|uniref:hypothetical protein n=1 Tax=Helicobacter sp. TaxID=218 RepID=UPI0019CB1E26|nr:hypothetical protein [Helicobacter sp.]MBD5164625.1 hypothetical protein [Helicobacter sp.]